MCRYGRRDMWREQGAMMTTVDDLRPMGHVLARPEPGLTVDDFVRRARDLRDHLRSEQEATERRTYYSQETHEIFQRDGFYRMLQPRTFGGYELRVSEFYRVIVEIARGCPSTGWCLALGSGHALAFCSQFGPEAQAEAMGKDGHFIAPHRVVPSVRAVPHADGWELTGTWSYNSGAPYSTHALGSVALPPGEDGTPRFGIAVVPRSCYTVLDDWGDGIGLRGSGSPSIRMENAVVPRGNVREAEGQDHMWAEPVGMALHGNPMYAGRLTGFFFGETLAVATGIGRAMLDEYRSALLEKKPMWSPHGLRADDAQYQQWYGEACSLLDAAAAVLQQVGELYHDLCEREARGEAEFGPADDLRLTNLCAQGGRYATEAMDLLVRTGGSSALRQESRTERYWRDFSAYRTHPATMTRDLMNRRFAAAELEAARQLRTAADTGSAAVNGDTAKAGA
ncbi:putative pigment production hydroxylase [Streptomyces himastatinicus ATCC 53653]|uniref:Putative pigment production hydroxylase n=2 Tax=Streptomyces violaceusniger group TaxID=2839105 RepID=D9WKY8_9ACTN|nr:putative pigment production hydroxylase [Streptomyces himastatinicus ATCC 53653]